MVTKLNITIVTQETTTCDDVRLSWWSDDMRMS